MKPSAEARQREEDQLLIDAINKKVWGGRRVQTGETAKPVWTPPSCVICGKETDVSQKDYEAEEDVNRLWVCSIKCLRTLPGVPQKPTRKIESNPAARRQATGCSVCGAPTSTGKRGRPPKYCPNHKEG